MIRLVCLLGLDQVLISEYLLYFCHLTLDRFTYNYDAHSNPLYKKNELDSTFSELYHANGTNSAYDGLDRLTDMRRGTLSDSNSDGIMDTVTTLNSTSGIEGNQKNWSLDALGNWNSVATDGSTTTRTHNAQNQLTADSSGPVYTYDNNGNTIDDSSLNNDGLTYFYDAWNRMVGYEDADTDFKHSLVYTYDGKGRRISRQVDTYNVDLSTTDVGALSDYYYSAAWQVLQENVSGLADVRYVYSPFYVDDVIERDRNFAAVRLNRDGSYDTSSGNTGLATISFSDDVSRQVELPSHARIQQKSTQAWAAGAGPGRG